MFVQVTTKVVLDAEKTKSRVEVWSQELRVHCRRSHTPGTRRDKGADMVSCVPGESLVLDEPTR